MENCPNFKHLIVHVIYIYIYIYTEAVMWLQFPNRYWNEGVGKIDPYQNATQFIQVCITLGMYSISFLKNIWLP